MSRNMTSYRNPVVRGLNPDPSVIRVGQDYYLATSSFHLFPGVPIYHSRDLVNWRLISHALTRPSQFMAERTGGRIEIYAPTLRYHDGVFYMITTNRVKDGGNFYVTTRDPAGEWSEPIFVDEGFFDPSLFFDDDGKVYYTRRGGIGITDTVQAEIDIKTGKLLTPLRPITRGFISEDCEGAHLYKIDGKYYLMQAEGGSRFLHMETIGRSDSPWGPFEPCPYNPILGQLRNWAYPVRSTGHAELVEAHDGSWWLYFLGTRHPGYNHFSAIGRETFLLPVTWKDGWPTTDVTQLSSLEVSAKLPPAHPWPQIPLREEFNSSGLDGRFVLINCNSSRAIDLQSRPGCLRLRPLGHTITEQSPTAFVGTRQTDIKFSAETLLSFIPRDERDSAGISVFQKWHYHYDLAVTASGGKRVLVLRRTVGDIRTEEQLAILPAVGPIRLKITADADYYQFHYADKSGNFTEVATALMNLISTELSGTWGGSLIGMFCISQDPANAPTADFDYLDYQAAE